MITISKGQLETHIRFEEVLSVLRDAFRAYSADRVLMPLPLVFPLQGGEGEICIKTAIADDLPTYTVKQVSVFKSNISRGLPTLNATMNIYDRSTGELLAVINEEGWLTNIRTAGAGALADRMFRKSKVQTLGVIGGGMQAECQTRMILLLNGGYSKVVFWNRDGRKAARLSEVLSLEFPEVEFAVMPSVADVIKSSDTVIAVTAAPDPVITSLDRDSVTLIGVGADMAEKCEIDPSVYKNADKVFVDSRSSNAVLGDIARGFRQGVLVPQDIMGELGEVTGTSARENDGEVICVKLVGLGAQDTYVGNYAYQLFK